MGTQAGVGMSHHRNPVIAGQEAAAQALQSTGIEKPDFVFMFASVGYDQQALLSAVRKVTGPAPLCGCSGAGVITMGQADESLFSVAVMAICSDAIRLTNGVALGLQADSARVGRAVAEAIRPELGGDALGVVVFADALTVNFDRFRDGLEAALDIDRFLPLWGGGSGDRWQWQRTYQYCNDEVVSDGVSWALLCGHMNVACAVNHGCVPIGRPRTVTRSAGNVIYEIDGKRALDVLKEYMRPDEVDRWERAVVSLAVGFKAPGYMLDQDEYILRVFVGRDEATGAISMPSEVVEGDSIWLARRDYEKISAGVDRIVEEIKTRVGPNRAEFVLQIECGGRGNTMLRDHQKMANIDKLQHNIGADVPWLGFYSYAEIGPIKQSNNLHNYTSVVLAFYRDECAQASAPASTPMISEHTVRSGPLAEDGPPPDELTQLRRENGRLAEEVKHLIEAEHNLYAIQDQLDSQYRLYRQLYEAGKQFNATLDLAKVLRIATQFVIYGLNFERCVILTRAPGEAHFRVQDLDGYYEEAAHQMIMALSLSVDAPLLTAMMSEAQPILCPAGCAQEPLLDLGRRLGMDEYVLMPLDDASGVVRLLAAGNTARLGAQQTRVEADSGALVGLANLISQLSTAIHNATFHQALKASEAKYRSLFEDSKDAIFISSIDGRLVDLNPTGLTLFGLRADEIASLNVADLYSNPDDRSRFRQEIEQKQAVSDFAVTMQRCDGSLFDALVSATLRRGEDGSFSGYQGIIRDITVQKHNERLQAENLRLSTELEVTQRLQQMILPKQHELLAIEGLEIAGYMQPADEVGGDYYDVLHHNGHVKIGIGDVTGHGLESGVLMLMTQMGVRTLLTHNETDPVQFMDVLNRTIYNNVQRMEIDKNLTLVLLDYVADPLGAGGRLNISGQHEELILVRRGGQVELVSTLDLGFPIGLDHEIATFIGQTTVELQAGDGVVLYTDGITEAENEAGAQYGMERLCAVISRHWVEAADAIKEAVIADVRAFIGAQTVFDDITLVVVKQK